MDRSAGCRLDERRGQIRTPPEERALTRPSSPTDSSTPDPTNDHPDIHFSQPFHTPSPLLVRSAHSRLRLERSLLIDLVSVAVLARLDLPSVACVRAHPPFTSSISNRYDHACLKSERGLRRPVCQAQTDEVSPPHPNLCRRTAADPLPSLDRRLARHDRTPEDRANATNELVGYVSTWSCS